MEENKKNKIPNVPNLRFSFIDEWKQFRLFEIADFLPGLTYSPADIRKDGRIVLRSSNIQNGLLDLNDLVFVDENIVKKNLSIKPFDVLMCIRNGSKKLVGKTAIIAVENPKLTWGAFMAIIRPTNKSTFVFHYLNSNSFYKQVFSDTNTATVNQITAGVYNGCKVFIPSQEEQQKISYFLDLINERIETQNKIIEKLKSLKIGIKERIYLLGKTKEPLERILYEVSEKSTVQNQYPVLSSTVKGLFLQSEYFDRAIASENNIGYKIVHKGQIIISPQNLWMGNLTFNDKYESGIVSPSYKIYEIDSKYSKKYIHWLLTSKRSFFNYGLVSEQGASIVRRNLNIDAFMELCLPIIKDKDDEFKIEKLIDLIENKLESEKKRGTLLNQQKQFLLSNLFI